MQSPIEAPEFIDPEVGEEILEFIESEEILPADQESPSQVIPKAPTEPKPTPVTPESEPAELEREATVTNDEVDLLNRTETPTRSAYVAELASREQKPAAPDSAAWMSPWLVGGAVAVVLTFIGYRKMMVR